MANINTDSLFIISGPSGAGEDSVIEQLGQKTDIERVVTTTTRSMREGESEGKPYHFISKKEFKKGVKNDEFFEYAVQDNGNLYGVTYEEIERVAESNKVGIWKVDYKGVITAKKMLPDIFAILIYAPLEILEERIRKRDRNTTEEFVQGRIEYAKGWLEHKDIFDYKVENRQNKLDETVDKVEKIIKENQPK